MNETGWLSSHSLRTYIGGRCFMPCTSSEIFAAAPPTMQKYDANYARGFNSRLSGCSGGRGLISNSR
jgi:hypothetical protein